MATEIKNQELQLEPEEIDDAISLAYDIATYPSDFTLSIIAQMWKDGDISIPDYQREFVWSISQSSLLIDSFLSGLPVPPVFFYIDEDNLNLVIDGQQRILSVVFFLEGYFGHEHQGKRQTFRLTGLKEGSRYANKKFSDLSESEQRKLKQSVLRAINIRQLSPVGESTSAYHIFERLNTGGTPLKPQEIRNCVFRGGFATTLKDLNNDQHWRKILGKPLKDKHLKDVELVLRVFSLFNSSENYEKPLKEYLNQAMKSHDKGKSSLVKKYKDAFPIVTEAIVTELGEKPFHLRGPLNVAALDSVMVVMCENARRLSGKKLSAAYKKLVNDKEFDHHTRINTTDKASVLKRIELVRQYFEF